MGLHDRPYWRDDGGRGGYGGGPMRGLAVGLPKPGAAVKWLLIINIVVFVLQVFVDRPSISNPYGLLSSHLGVTLNGFWQPWRYVTFQFLHGGMWHVALNMLGLYMLGTPLEQHWGTKRFTKFYLACGAFAGLAYVLMCALVAGGQDGPNAVATAARGLGDVPLIGASGGVFAIVLACAVLFPHFRLIFFLFPVPIRLAAVIIFGGMILVVLSGLTGRPGSQFWSDVAHLGGAVAAAFYIWVLPALRSGARQRRARLNEGAWRRKMEHRRADQAVINRILDKINREGLDSLTRRERDILRDATRRQQHNDRDLYKL